MAHENDWVINGDIPYRAGYPELKESINVFEEWVGTNKNWAEKEWPGSYNAIYGRQVWTDGTNIYHSYGGSSGSYVLNKTTGRWLKKSWSGSYYPNNGQYVWTDGENTYYSNNSSSTYLHTMLNKSTGQWVKKTWNITLIQGQDVWTDGENVYCSCVQQSGSYSFSRQYVLDKSTGNWVGKDWGDKYPTYGRNVWSDGENLYYSLNGINYVLDKTAGQWVDTTWYGLERFSGIYVWTDGKDIYYSNGSDQYILNKSTRTWTVKNWPNIPQFSGMDVWSDGENIYYSSGANQYILSSSVLPYRVQFPDLNTSRNLGDEWLIDNDIPYRYEYPELKESFNIGGEWLSKDEPDTSSTKKYLKFTHTITATFTAGNRTPVVTYDFPDSSYYTTPRYYSQGVSSWSNIYGRIFVPAYVKVRKDEWNLSNTDIYNIMDPSQTNYFKKLDGYTETIDPTSEKLHYDSGDYYWAYPSRDYGTNKYYVEFSLAMLRQLTPSESGSTTMTFSHIFEFDSENDDYRAFLATYPNNVEPWYPMRNSIPFRSEFPELIESVDIGDIWLISNDIPFRIEYPDLLISASGPNSWLQDKGWDPRRPWPEHRSIIQKVQTIPNIPDVDWTKSMQQTFEFYTVDPNNWYDDQKLENIISCDLTHDLTSDKRGNASISVTEPLPESYIRTYLVVTQAGYMHKICLGTYLYMTSSDSFDGMKHNITMTGYTPMVELEEKLPPLGFHVIGITNRKHSGNAPMVTEAIKDIVTTYTRCEIENRTVIQKPLLNDFVAGTNDNFLTVINNILNASSLGQYILTVDEWGTIIVKDKPVLEDAIPTYIYTDDNSSILLPSLDTNDDIYGIPNVVEVLYTGDKRLPAIRVIVKNEDPTSIVSIPARGREIAKRFTINNIAAPVNDYSEAAVRAQVTAQAERLLEAASTINKTISYSHGYCDVKVGDTVLINYERAGVTGIRAKVVSQRISCKPGCQVDEQAVYTKKLWNRGV